MSKFLYFEIIVSNDEHRTGQIYLKVKKLIKRYLLTERSIKVELFEIETTDLDKTKKLAELIPKTESDEYIYLDDDDIEYLRNGLNLDKNKNKTFLENGQMTSLTLDIFNLESDIQYLSSTDTIPLIEFEKDFLIELNMTNRRLARDNFISLREPVYKAEKNLYQILIELSYLGLLEIYSKKRDYINLKTKLTRYSLNKMIDEVADGKIPELLEPNLNSQFIEDLTENMSLAEIEIVVSGSENVISIYLTAAGSILRYLFGLKLDPTSVDLEVIADKVEKIFREGLMSSDWELYLFNKTGQLSKLDWLPDFLKNCGLDEKTDLKKIDEL